MIAALTILYVGKTPVIVTDGVLWFFGIPCLIISMILMLAILFDK